VAQRKNRAGKRYYQIVFKDVSGKVIKSKSCPPGMTKVQAVLLAKEEVGKGIVPTALDPFALPYCEEFWSNESVYFRQKAIRSEPLSESYRQSGFYNLKHYKPYLAGKTMSQLTAEGMEEFADSLAVKGVGARSINHGMDAVKRPYAVYCKKQRIANGLKEAEHHKYAPTERGTFTEKEIDAIYASGLDDRAKLILMLGIHCGLRKGEVRGLKFEDVDFNTAGGLDKGSIKIRHNVVTKKEGVKAPKCKSYRQIPLPWSVRKLIKSVRENYACGVFVVPNLGNPSEPCDAVSVKRAFNRAMIALKITPEARKTRNLVFHSCRHTFVSLLRAKGIPLATVAAVSGHKSEAMVDDYTHVKGFVDYSSINRILDATPSVQLDCMCYTPN
jgi:integrase